MHDMGGMLAACMGGMGVMLPLMFAFWGALAAAIRVYSE